MKELGDKLSDQKLNAEELNELEDLARQLYERSVILNYKAKEEQVHGKSNVMDKEEAVEKVEKTTTEPIIEEKKESVQDESKEDTGEIQFDFSDDNESEQLDADFQNETDQNEVETEDIEEEVKSEKETEQFDQQTEQKESVNEAAENEMTRSFYERFEKVHNESLGDRLGASKLDTLKGAIGLNDRLQFIAELFSGDSDKFNRTIEALDQQPSNEDARKTLSQVAAKQSWDEENPLVEEFAKLIERRYVED